MQLGTSAVFAEAEPPSLLVPHADGARGDVQEPPRPIFGVSGVFAFTSRRFPSFLIVGALVALTGVAGSGASWAFPGMSAAIAGGADVEIIEVEYLTSAHDEIFVKAAAPFTGAPRVTYEPESLEISSLITVPWTPVLPEGAGGRDVHTHTVSGGETLGVIAVRYGVTTTAIAFSNNIVDPDSIQPGDTLRIPPVEGVLHSVKSSETLVGIAKKYGVDAAEVLSFNGLPADGSVLTVGDELVIPNGRPPAPPAPKPITISRTSAPSYASSTVALGYYIAPTTGYNYGRRHSNNGVDIANSCGTPIYAAAAGTISRAATGWNGGYGTVVEVVHPNGTDTRYAHLSSIVVASGSVAQGQLIGLMGTTGRSTGCHLHFEVHGARNPLVR